MKELIKQVKNRVDYASEVSDWDSYEEVLKLGIRCGIVQAYAEGGGTVEVLWSNDALIRYLTMEVSQVVLKAIVREFPEKESNKSVASSARSATVRGAEVKSAQEA